jgi:hypothetical protein
VVASGLSQPVAVAASNPIEPGGLDTVWRATGTEPMLANDRIWTRSADGSPQGMATVTEWSALRSMPAPHRCRRTRQPGRLKSSRLSRLRDSARLSILAAVVGAARPATAVGGEAAAVHGG